MSRLMKIAFWATVAGQIILLIAFIGVKENVLRTGASVLLQAVPIDPRSLLQGDYAILDYEIAELPAWAADSKTGDVFFVELIEDGDGVWRAGRYSRENLGKDQVFIKGSVNSRGRLDFGIGTYFIPEGTGRIIEQAGDVKARVAVSSGGTAVIEELLVDGEPFDPRHLTQPLRPPEGEPLPPGQARPPSGEVLAVDDFRIGVKGDALEFQNDVMFALPGGEITVTFNNSSSVHSHNLVIVQSKTKDAVAADGIAAGPANDWVPPGDNRVIANTRLLGPGETGEVRFMAPKPGQYQFLCTFPGHNSTMFGDFIVLEPERVQPER